MVKKAGVRFDEKVGAYRIDYYWNGYRTYSYSSWAIIAYFKKFWFLYVSTGA